MEMLATKRDNKSIYQYMATVQKEYCIIVKVMELQKCNPWSILYREMLSGPRFK